MIETGKYKFPWSSFAHSCAHWGSRSKRKSGETRSLHTIAWNVFLRLLCSGSSRNCSRTCYTLSHTWEGAVSKSEQNHRQESHHQIPFSSMVMTMMSFLSPFTLRPNRQVIPFEISHTKLDSSFGVNCSVSISSRRTRVLSKKLQGSRS